MIPAPSMSRLSAQAVREAGTPTREEVLAGLLREARGQTVNTSSAARVTAWRLIGEHLGMWQPEKDTRPQSGLEKLVDHMAALREHRNRERGLE